MVATGRSTQSSVWATMGRRGPGGSGAGVARAVAVGGGGAGRRGVGGPGGGKTRVLQAFAEGARQAGAAVIAGRAPAVGGYPYAALADALGAYVRSSAPAGGVVRRAGDALVRLVPALVALEGSSGAETLAGPPDALAVVQAGDRLGREITQRRPLGLGVDDAQLAAADT